MFLSAQARAYARFQRAIERRALWMPEDAAGELSNLPLEDALQLIHLYTERGSPKYEKAVLRWLEEGVRIGHDPRSRRFGRGRAQRH